MSGPSTPGRLVVVGGAGGTSALLEDLDRAGAVLALAAAAWQDAAGAAAR